MVTIIQTSPENFISNLSDLVEEIRDEMDDDTFSLTRIYRAIGRAEAIFNRELRCPKMETEATITITQEATELPEDFLQLRQIYSEGTPDSPLSAMSPAALRRTYRGVEGIPMAYALENRRIIIGPVGELNATLLYYGRIPALTDNNPVNWLIDENPDLYLHQVLAILFNKIGDTEKGALNIGIAQDILQSINVSGVGNRWGAAPLVPQGMRQVRGART